MAIAFNCPHCLFSYRLPDKYGGKQARCKNPECRQIITIPKPITIPDDAAAPLSQEEADTLALAALADEPSAAPTESASADKPIPVNCPYCDHKWTVPRAMGGKNVLCPNPECRQRVRVEQPKDDGPTDWRQFKTKLPSGAKQNFEKLEGVQDAADVRIVSGTALREADATGVEVEPRSLKEKLAIALTILGLIAGGVLSGWLLVNRRVAVQEDQLIADARAEFTKLAPELNPTEAALASALLHLAAAEHALRHNEFKKTKEAQNLLGQALDEVRRQPPGSIVRSLIAYEVALTTLTFGGNDEEVAEQLRFRWLPDINPTRPTRINEKTPTVHEELGRALVLLIGTDAELRFVIARRLTRELIRRGRADVAAAIIPLTLFTDGEREEARAVVALEVYRADAQSPLPQQTAEELKGLKPQNAPSAQTLFSALKINKPVLYGPPPPGTGPVASEGSLLAYTGLRLLENKPEEALALAQRGPRPDVQLKLLALCAEWSPDPTAAVATAKRVIETYRGKRDVSLNPAHIIRITLAAANSGQVDMSHELANTLTDEGLRAWLKAAVIRELVASRPDQKAEETWAEAPDDPKRFRAGHALGRMLVARHNTQLSHDREKEKKETALWPTPARPFALAGIALGLQD